MPKKKTNSLFATIDSNTASNNAEPEVLETTSLSAAVENVNTEIVETDDLVQNLKNEISKLNADNAALSEKLAVYIENKTTDAFDSISISAELEKLRNEKNALQNENDTYLMKISELSFENAKLTSQLQQLQSLSKDPNVAAPIYSSNNTRQNCSTSKSNVVSYNKPNGYAYWN